LLKKIHTGCPGWAWPPAERAEEQTTEAHRSKINCGTCPDQASCPATIGGDRGYWEILRKCGDDRYLIVCPHLNRVSPSGGTFTLLEVLRWFENEPRDHERPEGPFWPAL
jgi:hypothetical protein